MTTFVLFSLSEHQSGVGVRLFSFLTRVEAANRRERLTFYFPSCSVRVADENKRIISVLFAVTFPPYGTNKGLSCYLRIKSDFISLGCVWTELKMCSVT